MSTAEYWAELVTVALLGTDRREPPAPPPGGFADLAADLQPGATAAGLAQQVAAVAAVRRAAFTPGAPADVLQPPAADVRPVTSPAACAAWQKVVADWPVVEDEWLLAVVRGGWRLSPELVVPLLARHRGDEVRHARVRVAAGPLGEWMVDWSPPLGRTSRKALPPEELAARLAHLPELPITPDLAPLVERIGPEGAREVAAALAGGLSNGSLTVANRAVLVNLCARLHRSVLRPVAAALLRVDPSRPSIGLALALADLLSLRALLLDQLEPE